MATHKKSSWLLKLGDYAINVLAAQKRLFLILRTNFTRGGEFAIKVPASRKPLILPSLPCLRHGKELARGWVLRGLYDSDRIPWWRAYLLGLDREFVAITNKLMRANLPRDKFWAVYSTLPGIYQAVAVSWFDRHVGLQQGDSFYLNSVTSRMWLHGDPQEWAIPIELVWRWIQKSHSLQLEACYLLAGYDFESLKNTMARHVQGEQQESQNNGFWWWSFIMATVFRMSFRQYREKLEAEEPQLVSYYGGWPLESRVYFLQGLSLVPFKYCDGFLQRNLKLLFTEAAHVVDIAQDLGQHPAKAVLDWYTQKNDQAPQEYCLDDVFN